LKKGLEIQRNFFEHILDNIPADIAVFDIHHTYIFVNKRGIKNKELREWMIGKTDFDYCQSKGMSIEIATNRRRFFDETIKNKKEFEFIDEHKNQGGSQFVLRKFYPHFENKELKFVIGYGTDITLVKKVELKLEDTLNKLKKTNEELEQFAYVASHDLQEPLRMVTSFLSLLEKKYNNDLDEKAKSYIHFAVDGSQRMRQIILDLLEFSRVGKLGEHEMEDLNLNHLLDGIIKLHMQQIMDTGAKIKYGPLPTIRNLRIPITQVLQNLVSNALKYKKEDQSPILEIAVLEKDLDWEFSFKDNGIGIHPKYFTKIFEIFQRLHNKNTYSGTGIGLSVVKKTIESLGGQIWLDSEEGVGTTFFFTVPKNLKKSNQFSDLIEQPSLETS
jgi:signal transduction histidine kinase